MLGISCFKSRHDYQGYQISTVLFNTGLTKVVWRWTVEYRQGWTYQHQDTTMEGRCREYSRPWLRQYQPSEQRSKSFNKHVDVICKSCNFHIRALCQISEDIAAIACSLIDGQLDCCKFVLHRILALIIIHLQRIQISAAVSSQGDGPRTTSYQFMQISTDYQSSTDSSISSQSTFT